MSFRVGGNEISFTCPVTGSIVVDGLCLLHLIWQKVDPSLTVNVETLRARIESSGLHGHENNVDTMLTEIEDTFRISNIFPFLSFTLVNKCLKRVSTSSFSFL